MSRSKEKVLTITVLLTALAFWLTSIASAQVSEPSTGEDEAAVQDTVVVAARRRSENVQEIPGAITVVTGSTIETARVEQVADVIALTPGANLRENFSPAFTNLTVRGIPTQQNGELPIALSVDGVTVPFTSFLNQDLLDVDQIEVLKGPQGGLYGRNAIAGAINISTRRPSDEVEGRVRLSYGNGDYLQAFGTVSGPLADGVYGKLGVSYKEFDGLIESGQVDETLDFHEEFSTFGRLIFEPTDNLSLDFRGRYTTSDTGASYFEVVPLTDIDNFDTEPLVNAPANNDRELYELTSKIDYETDAGTFTSITGYFDVEDSLRGESDFGVFAPPEQLQEFDTTVDGWSQEFRFTSPDDQPFRWLLGAFYQDRTVTTFTNILVDPGDTDPFPVFLVEDSTNDSESYAIFGQGTYDLTDRLELSVALRYDEDQRSTVDLAQSTESLSRTFSQFQPKVSLSYDVSDDALLYATWGKGFRSGSFNGFAAPVEVRTFDAEVSTNYEVGFKSTLADGRLIANGSLYFINYEDQQFFAFFDAFTSAIVNADATDIYGVELELAFNVNDYLELFGTFGYVDGEISENAPDANGDTFIGNTSPGSNEYTANFAAVYTVPIGGNLDWVSRIDYEKRGEIFYEFNNFHRTAPTDFVNLRTAVESDNWSFSLFARNATDERYSLTAESFLGSDTVFRLPSSKRRYGGEFTYKF